MPKKLSKAAIKEHLTEFASLAKRIATAEAKMTTEMQPAIQDFETATAAIRQAHEPKIQKLRDQQLAIEKQVISWLEEQPKDITIGTDKAEAIRKTETSVGARVIDVKKFLEIVKTKGDAAIECINVVINKAEKLLGKKEVDAISTKPETTKVTTQINLK